MLLFLFFLFKLSCFVIIFFFFSSRRRHTRWNCDWSSDVCSSDLGVDVPGVDASMSPRPQPRRAMRWADVYVCMLADGVALRNRCPQGQADPRAAIAGGASGVTMARAGPHPRRARSMRWADV